MARLLRSEGHETWSAYEAHLSEASDRDLIAYAEDKKAIAVTHNKDFAATARVMRSARTIYLRVTEDKAVIAMRRALEWIAANRFPDGRVVRVTIGKTPELMTPL